MHTTKKWEAIAGGVIAVTAVFIGFVIGLLIKFIRNLVNNVSSREENL